ncbi:hypothetical protein JTB14_014770 [Gonioctena quinquepunctata]|nr:hypothetical protein JTB14_014770 [Gonioctena quinquepunctata]
MCGVTLYLPKKLYTYKEGKLAKTYLASNGEDSNCGIGVIQKRRKKPNRKYRDDSISPPPDLCGASSSNKSENITLLIPIPQK